MHRSSSRPSQQIPWDVAILIPPDCDSAIAWATSREQVVSGCKEGLVMLTQLSKITNAPHVHIVGLTGTICMTMLELGRHRRRGYLLWALAREQRAETHTMTHPACELLRPPPDCVRRHRSYELSSGAAEMRCSGVLRQQLQDARVGVQLGPVCVAGAERPKEQRLLGSAGGHALLHLVLECQVSVDALDVL